MKKNMLKVKEVTSCKSGNKEVFRVSLEGKCQNSLLVNPTESYWYQSKKIKAKEIEAFMFAEEPLEPGDPADPWEIYGSDYSSGVALFGTKKDLDKLSPQIYSVIEKAACNSSSVLDDHPLMINRWNFDDKTSLFLINIDPDQFNIKNIDLEFKNIITVVYGAVAEDLLLSEIMFGKVYTLLKKFKIPNENDEIDFDEENDECISLGSKELTKKDSDLLINMAKHVYCTLMGWNHSEETDRNDVLLAKKLEKYQEFKSVGLPASTTTAELVYQEGNSNKFYNVLFKEDNTNYNVTVAYGKVGGKEKFDNIISTDKLEDAQEKFLKIIEEKIAKGYGIKKNKPKIKP